MAGVVQDWETFTEAMAALIDKSQFRLIYIKCGVPELSMWEKMLSKQNRMAWLTKYYGGENAQLLASNSIDVWQCEKPPESKSSTNAIAQFADVVGIKSVVDVCVGKGKMLKKFQVAGMRVLGIELCESRAREAAKRLGAE